ncbi:MAG TPA: hypothetical protein VGF86_16070 [Candidatus Tumulicola sp.]|jgi:hypothetical protein
MHIQLRFCGLLRAGRNAGTALLVAAFVGSGFWGLLQPRTALAATTGSFQTTANPGGGSILTGTLGSSSLSAATAVLLRRVHTELGARPTVVQVAVNNRDHSLALLFTATRSSTPYTGIAIVTANAGSQAAGAALYDTSARFHTTVGPMMRRLQGMTVASASKTANGSSRRFAPPERLIPHAFSDGTGSISIPADWTLKVADGGSAIAVGPGGSAQVSYNMHFTGVDPSNPRAQMYLRTASPIARANLHGAVLPYTGDPVGSWTSMYQAMAKSELPPIHVTRSTSTGTATAIMSGIMGSGEKSVHFIAHVFLLPPNPNGMWQLTDSHVFVADAQFARQAETANAVLNSVRINFGALNAQQDAIRQSFQRQFEAEIANDQAQDAARQESTDEALASDRAAQEGMHRQAVAMENYSLDRAVVVNTATGVHSTVDSGFAAALVQGNSNYQQVPAAELLRGVDY